MFNDQSLCSNQRHHETADIYSLWPIEALQNSFFHGVIQFNWCYWHSTAHRNISKKFVMLWAWKWSKTQIIWGTRKLIRDGIHGLPVSWQTQCHWVLGRTVHACKCGPCTATAGFPPTGGCCYSRGLMNETRIASTVVEGGQEQETAARVTALQVEAINQKAWKAQIQGNQDPTPLIPILIECQSPMQIWGRGAWWQSLLFLQN